MNVSPGFKRLLSLRIANLIVKRFVSGQSPITSGEISHYLDLPIRLVNQIIYELLSAGIISEVSINEDRDLGYQPAVDPEKITIKRVIEALDENGNRNIPVHRSKELDEIEKSLKEFSQLIEGASANRLLKEI